MVSSARLSAESHQQRVRWYPRGTSEEQEKKAWAQSTTVESPRKQSTKDKKLRKKSDLWLLIWDADEAGT